MGEGRYRTLLCLIQLAVPEPDAGSANGSSCVDPLAEDLDGAPLADVLADPDVPGGRARRAPGHRADAPAPADRGAQRVRHAGRGGLRGAAARSPPMTRCWRELLGVRRRQERELHALGRAAAVARAAGVRARGRRAPAGAGGRAGTPADRARAAGVGARGVRAARSARATSATRRRSSRGCRACAA